MIKKYKIRDLISKINWEPFFVEWKFHRRFASVANAEGCDVVKANWLTEFAEKDRAKASEAMQLLKEAYRMLEILDKDYSVTTLHGITQALPASLQELVAIGPTHKPYTLMVAVSEAEVDDLFEKNENKRKMVTTLMNRLVEAAITTTREEIAENKQSFGIDPQSKTPQLWKQIDEVLDFQQIGVRIGEKGNLLPLTAQCAIVM